MKVRIRMAHRAERPREDGSPGFRDLSPGDVIEIPEGEFSDVLHERVENRPPQIAQTLPMRRPRQSAESA